MNRGHFLLFRFKEIPVVVTEQSCGLNAICAQRESHGAILHVSGLKHFSAEQVLEE